MNTTAPLQRHWLDTLEDFTPEQIHRQQILAYALTAAGWSAPDAGRLATEKVLAEVLEHQVDAHGVPPIGSTIQRHLTDFGG